MSRGHIYKLLGNPLYVGRIAHKGKTYDGQHPPIIGAETWTKVEARLAAYARERRRASEPSPLRGKLLDQAGAALTPSHAVKSGRRYRYYVSRDLITGSGKDNANTQANGWRLPAGEIERIVEEAVTDFLADRAALTHAAQESGVTIDCVPRLLGSAARWQGKGLDLVERIHLDADEIAITLSLTHLIGEAGRVRHVIPVRIKRRGVEMRLVLEGAGSGADAPKPDPALIKAVARAHKWFGDLASGRARSLAELAKAEGLSDRYVSRLVLLAFLAPKIVEAILAGTQPVELTAEILTKRAELPLSWVEQKSMLGFN